MKACSNRMGSDEVAKVNAARRAMKGKGVDARDASTIWPCEVGRRSRRPQKLVC